VNIACRWWLFAFFFGYVFPYIRGNSGIQKAFWAVAPMVAPPLIATALLTPADRSAWFGAGFWGLEMLITAMLLGLVAGDLETLRRAGYGWRDLVEIHRAGSLSAWASTLAVAIGTTATAILSSSFGAILSEALHYAGLVQATPQLPIH
jgi:hypothetical protein